jgi:Acyl-CoA dehydrogenase, C-terminal domain
VHVPRARRRVARATPPTRVKGFLVEKGTPGFRARRIERKASLRAVWQAEIALDGVRVEAHDRLPEANSFTDTARVLAATRSSSAWMALGHALAGFGRTLAHFQIVQQRLVRMLADVTAMQLYCLQTARLAERGALTDTLAGLAKLHNTTRAAGNRAAPGMTTNTATRQGELDFRAHGALRTVMPLGVNRLQHGVRMVTPRSKRVSAAARRADPRERPSRPGAGCNAGRAAQSGAWCGRAAGPGVRRPFGCRGRTSARGPGRSSPRFATWRGRARCAHR